MPSTFNSEFNYRTQVVGETIWEKIKTLNGFLEGRVRACALEKVGALRYQAKVEKVKWLEAKGGPLHEVLELQAEIVELDSVAESSRIAYELNRGEVEMLKRLLAEAYAVAEPTRIHGYTDEQMYEANAANEFTVWVAKEIQAEIIANGRPSPAKLRNAMSNPQSFHALQQIGLIPKEAAMLCGSDDPLRIELKTILLEHLDETL